LNREQKGDQRKKESERRVCLFQFRIADSAQKQDASGLIIHYQEDEGMIGTEHRNFWLFRTCCCLRHFNCSSCRRLGSLFIDIDISLMDDLADEERPVGAYAGEISHLGEGSGHSQIGQALCQEVIGLELEPGKIDIHAPLLQAVSPPVQIFR